MPVSDFNQTISGSSANTGRAVKRLNDSAGGVKLELPDGVDLTSPEGVALLNNRLRQIEIEIERLADYEIGLAAKVAYGELASLTGTAQPVTGAKLSLDKLGNWLLLAHVEFSAAASEAFVVVDSEDTATAKRQAAYVISAGAHTAQGFALFTATKIPRLVQLYAKGSGDIGDKTHIGAVWLGNWTPGAKRFGRQTATDVVSVTDLNGDTITDHGEEVRYPKADHPDRLPVPVDLSW